MLNLLKVRELRLGLLAILLGVVVIAPGFITIDEFIYYLGARAVAEHGSLMVGNGYPQFQSEALTIRLLVYGPGGLTPQYPAGSALLAAPLIPLLGPKAFILLNGLAGVATLFTTWKICLAHFKDEAVARISIVLLLLGTFWFEYAVGVWPHMLSTFLVVQAYWFALRHVSSERNEVRSALLAGFFAGAGMLFRLDAVFAVPAIGLILFLFAERYLRSSFLFGTGVLPALGLAAWLNYLKFGSPNPLSYGQPAGNTNISAYGPTLAALCAAFLLVILYRKFNPKLNRKPALVALAIGLVAVVLVSLTTALLDRFWNGFVTLLIDMRWVEDQRRGVGPGPGDTLLFWGIPKKALGQSMPWIGLLAMLLTANMREEAKCGFAMLLLFTGSMIAPFILLSWHGGGGGNMRYFLPVVPGVCMMCAMLLRDLWLATPEAGKFIRAGIVAALGSFIAWLHLTQSGLAGIQQILSTYVFLATAAAAIAAGARWPLQAPAKNLTLSLVAMGFTLAVAINALDFRVAWNKRAFSQVANVASAGLPANSLLFTIPEWVGVQVPRRDLIVAEREFQSNRLDQPLIEQALAQGFRVFLTDFEFDATRDVPSGFEVVPTNYYHPKGKVLELRRSEHPRLKSGD